MTRTAHLFGDQAAELLRESQVLSERTVEELLEAVNSRRSLLRHRRRSGASVRRRRGRYDVGTAAAFGVCARARAAVLGALREGDILQTGDGGFEALQERLQVVDACTAKFGDDGGAGEVGRAAHRVNDAHAAVEARAVRYIPW